MSNRAQKMYKLLKITMEILIINIMNLLNQVINMLRYQNMFLMEVKTYQKI